MLAGGVGACPELVEGLVPSTAGINIVIKPVIPPTMAVAACAVEGDEMIAPKAGWPEAIEIALLTVKKPLTSAVQLIITASLANEISNRCNKTFARLRLDRNWKEFQIFPSAQLAPHPAI